MDIFLVLRVVVALAAVFGALFYGHRWITKGRPGALAKNRQIAVVARQGLGAKAGIAIVDAAGRRYLLGVTEHTVTVLDTLGDTPSEEGGTTAVPALVGTQPVTVTRFEQELRTVTITTGNMPVLVQHGPDGADPAPPVLRLTAAVPVQRAEQPQAAAAPTSRRALRQAEQLRTQAQQGPLAGSVLSPATWRQTVDALKRAR